jgi:hypothetical protein
MMHSISRSSRPCPDSIKKEGEQIFAQRVDPKYCRRTRDVVHAAIEWIQKYLASNNKKLVIYTNEGDGIVRGIASAFNAPWISKELPEIQWEMRIKEFTYHESCRLIFFSEETFFKLKPFSMSLPTLSIVSRDLFEFWE